MKKVSVIGHFADGLEYLDGQTIKTKVITNELNKEFGLANVLRFDTHGGKKILLKAPIYVWRAMAQSKNVIVMPAHNGLHVFGRLLPFFKHFYRKRKIHYIVIGGWLPQLLDSNESLARNLRKFDGIYVETNTMKMTLESKGFQNIILMPNCKELVTLSADELIYQEEIPFKLCTFSRVMKEKGIEDAIEAVKSVNLFGRKILYTLDIYGQVDPTQKEWFDKLKKSFPAYIKYCGVVPFDRSVDVLKNYFALLFPTRFFTEGIPGTIIDAYAAGVPVICSRWQSFNDIVDETVTGYGYDFKCVDDLKRVLIDIAESAVEFNSKKKNCLIKSRSYIPSEVIRIIIKQLL